jgi:hypothetical protein
MLISNDVTCLNVVERYGYLWFQRKPWGSPDVGPLGDANLKTSGPLSQGRWECCLAHVVWFVLALLVLRVLGGSLRGVCLAGDSWTTGYKAWVHRCVLLMFVEDRIGMTSCH